MIWNTTYHLTFRGPESLADSALRESPEEVGRSLNVFDDVSRLASKPWKLGACEH